ncbi:MAG: BatD family protein [Bacteroidota bacterium]
MKKILIFTFLFMSMGKLYADDDISIKAKAPNVVKQGEQFRLVYSINAKADDFEAPSIENFRVLAGPSTSTSTNVSIINGKMTKNIELKYTYVLEAEEKGNFSIPPAKVEVDGEVYKSNSLDIEVIDGKSSGSRQKSSKQSRADEQESQDPGDKLFVRVLVDDRDVYRDEPIVATLKLYAQLRVSDLRNVKIPDFSGFYKQEIPTPDLRQLEKENVDGEIYQTGVLKKYLLFPQQTGNTTIEPFKLDFIVQKQVKSGSSRSIFDDFFGSYKNEKMPVESDPVNINVRPLPEGKPTGFNGGVGSFQIEASLDKESVKTNEGVNFKVKVSGKGNLKIFDEPQVNFPPELETYDPKVTNNIDVSESGAKGSKEYEYLIVPRTGGEYNIPPVKFSYFDLSSKSYKTIKTNPVKLQVEKGEGDTTSGLTSSFSQQDINLIGSDIRYIKTGDFDVKERDNFLFGSFWFYFVYIFGIVCFALLYLFRRKKMKENANIALAKNKKANKFAKKRLKEASKHLANADKDKFYEETLHALWGYLGDKLSISVAELSREKAKERLMEKNIDEELTEQFLRLIDDCEFARYAPSLGEEKMDELYKEAIDVISRLQQKLK